MEQLQQQLPQQHSSVQFAPHTQLPMAILMQGSGPNRIDPEAAGGEGCDKRSQPVVHGRLLVVIHELKPTTV
jgi:hypothetical protein